MSNIMVLIIEDDKIQANELRKSLESSGMQVRHISTELQFQQLIRESGTLPFALAIVDMMLRWTDPSPQMEMPPPEILAEGFYVAGLRCCRALRTRGVKSIIFTALDPAKIPLLTPEEFKIVNKSRGYEGLLKEIQPELKQLRG
jgi:CheY-like chemotaxis protein